MDGNGSLYVTDSEKHEVRRYRREESEGTVFAGGNGRGSGLDQLDHPSYVFVDRNHSVYVSDLGNHSVMKWMKGATEGIIVTCGQEARNNSYKRFGPHGVVVDQLGTVYAVGFDNLRIGNHRITRWHQGGREGTIFANGSQLGWFDQYQGLSFDLEGNLYVTDRTNHQVEKYELDFNE